MKVKNFFMMAAVGLMAVVSLSSCDDILGEWDKPAGSGAVAPQNPQTTTTITLNLDGNLFNNDKLYLLSGDAAINIATITEGAPVTITSSDENVITIDADGNVVPVGPGTATITIKVTENSEYTGATETVTIVVGRKVSLADETGTEFVAQNGDQITGTAPNTMHLSVPDGALVRLKDATIKPTSGTATAAIVCAGDATIILEGENVVQGMSNKAGLQVGPEGKTLIIDGAGSIEAKCNATYTNYSAAGIGSNKDESCGNITIKNGSITAKAGKGAAIGSGWSGSCQDILIEGGTVIAQVEQNDNACGAGIGSGFRGSCGNITITGGDVTASTKTTNVLGHPHGAGIGTSGFDSSCGDITISGGNISAICYFNTGVSGGGAGIGTGYNSSEHTNQTCGNIIISGGKIFAKGGQGSAGIGLGHISGSTMTTTIGNIVVSGGVVNAIKNTSSGDDIGKGIGGGIINAGTVTVASSVTYNGTKGYEATATGYNMVP